MPECIYRKDGGHKHFPVFKKLKQHFMKVHAEKKYQCSKCSRNFGLDRDRKWHEESCGVTYTCKSCDHWYFTREALATHCSRANHPYPQEYKPKKASIAKSKGSAVTPPLPDMVFQVYVEGPKMSLKPKTSPASRPSGLKPLLPKSNAPEKMAAIQLKGPVMHFLPSHNTQSVDTQTEPGVNHTSMAIQTLPSLNRYQPHLQAPIPGGTNSAILSPHRGLASGQHALHAANIRTATATQTRDRREVSTETQTLTKRSLQVAGTQTAGDYIVREAMRAAHIPAVKISKGSQVSPKSAARGPSPNFKHVNQTSRRRKNRPRRSSAPYTITCQQTQNKTLSRDSNTATASKQGTPHATAVGSTRSELIGQRGPHPSMVNTVTMATRNTATVDSGTTMDDLPWNSACSTDLASASAVKTSTGLASTSSGVFVHRRLPRSNRTFAHTSGLPQPLSLTDFTESGTQTSALLEELERLAESIATQTQSSFLNTQHYGGTQSSQTQTAISTLDREISPDRIIRERLTPGSGLNINANILYGHKQNNANQSENPLISVSPTRGPMIGGCPGIRENQEDEMGNADVTEMGTSTRTFGFTHMETQTVENPLLGTMFSDSGVQTADDFMNMETQTVNDWVDEFLSCMGTQTDDILFPDLSLADIQTQTEAPDDSATVSSAFSQSSSITGLEIHSHQRHLSMNISTTSRAMDCQTQTTEAPPSGNILSNIEIQTSLHSLPSSAELTQSTEIETQTRFSSSIDCHTQTMMDRDLQSLLEELEEKSV
ncbi:ATM interactor-like [Lingula anatina]|uniref:ATM interactor-like n=1 Tax=Lingula anatina TaxID=7574 RepID=A0A1S3IF92_LINAN|nr:ATM interactor-like [Lingula anatina]|eukprot:XP_013396813.1 ATM interactor-like [Lingula anatina]